MARLIRMDQTGHTTLAEWTAGDDAATAAAVAAFREQLDAGYYAVVSSGEGHAEQVRELPRDADLVILRRPIAGGWWSRSRLSQWCTPGASPRCTRTAAPTSSGRARAGPRRPSRPRSGCSATCSAT